MKGHRIDNNFSLFEEADSPKSNSGNKLEVVKLVYDHADSVTWQDLFSGYNHLCAITFSSGILLLLSALMRMSKLLHLRLSEEPSYAVWKLASQILK